MKRYLIALIVLCLPALALGQTVTNPSKIAWTYTPEEHAATPKYEVGYFVGAAAVPAQTAQILSAQVTLVGGEYQATLPRPAFGTFTAKLKACNSSAVCSDWSAPSGPFVLSWIQPPIPTSPATVKVTP